MIIKNIPQERTDLPRPISIVLQAFVFVIIAGLTALTAVLFFQLCRDILTQ